MADLILGELEILKAQVLPVTLVTRSDWDAQISAIGKSVAKAFDAHCNRILRRAVDFEEIIAADTTFSALSIYPVESISEVALRSTFDGAFVATANTIVDMAEDGGIVYFFGQLGTGDQRARITYTGGYWVDVTTDQSDTLPTGATALPSDIFNAWCIQVQREILLRDALGTRGLNEEIAPNAGDLELLPSVKAMLAKYVRFT